MPFWIIWVWLIGRWAKHQANAEKIEQPTSVQQNSIQNIIARWFNPQAKIQSWLLIIEIKGQRQNEKCFKNYEQ